MDHRTSMQTTSGTAEPGPLPALDVLIDVMGGLESDGSDPARILRRVMTHVVEILGADAAVVVRQGSDGSHEHIRALGSLDDSDMAEHILGRLPRPLPPVRTLIDSDLLLLPIDTYHLVTLLGQGKRPRSDALYLVELITRHAGQAIENARLRDELAHNENLSAVGKAVRRVLHDLRNPIGRIHVAVDRANVPGTDAETVRRMHAIIASAADDVLTIANEVSDFTSSGKITKIRITAESLLAALRDSCTGLIIELRCINEHNGTVHCDPQKLLRALTRLIDGVYAPSQQGLPGDEREARPPLVEVRITQDSADTVITMSDHGPAIPESMRARIFEPFAGPSVQGTKGLGLAIARSIVRAHGGDITIGGDAQNSFFAVRLPGAGDAVSRGLGPSPRKAQDSRLL